MSLDHQSLETSSDAFLGGALHLRQPVRGYRAGVDPVLLAASCAASPGDRVLDCGAGVGTVGLCVARRLAGVAVTLVEREPVYAVLAAKNITSNALADRVTLISADVTRPLSQHAELAARVGTFTHLLANPPYADQAGGTRSADPLKDAANSMRAGDLGAWLRFAAAMLQPGGHLKIIHRPDALPELLDGMKGRFGGISIRPLQPYAGQSAHRILISASKGSRAPLVLHAPLILHAPGGSYQPNIEAVLRAGAALV